MPQSWYDAGSRPRVLINWQSFVDQGISNAWQTPFTDAIINAYTRWMTIASPDIRFQFWGYTTQTQSNDGELVISMNRRHAPTENRLASTFGSYNKLIIVFHRRAGDDTTLWNFVPYNAGPGEFDMQGIATHELGHCYGLDHSSSTDETMFASYQYHRQRYGPFEGDVATLKTYAGTFNRNRIRQLRSGDGAGSWAPEPNNLTDYNNNDARTTLTPGAAHIGSSGRYVVGWSIPNRIPTWLRGDGRTFAFNEWLYYGGERSVHGPAYASDDAGRMLWAWVHNDVAASLRMVTSTDGYSWSWTGVPPGAATAGVPALAWTRVNGQSTWICAWARFDRTDHDRTGRIYASISTNNGASWSTPVELSATHKALAGVSAAATPNNQVVVAFALAPTGTSAGMNAIRTFGCDVAGGRLNVRSVQSLGETTRIQPAVTFDYGHNRFVLATREQNYLTTIATLWKGPNAGDAWTGRVFLGDNRSNTAPALTSSPTRNECRLFYGWED